MKNNLLKRFNEENATPEQITNLRIRNAVRVVLIDKKLEVAIIHVKKHDYYSLPGGGVEKETKEAIHDALIRETKEETGCEIEVIGEIGTIEEVQLKNNLLNRSHGFVAKVNGEKEKPVLNQDEIEEGFELIWVDIDNAIKLVGNYSPDTKLYHRYFLQRELTFLEQARHKNPNLFS